MSKVHQLRSRALKKRKTKRRPQESDLSAELGASQSFTITQQPDGPFGVAALLEEIRNRLVSRGGRPSDSGPTVRRLVPLRKTVWSSLKAQAEFLSNHGKRVSPAQLAAMLVEKSLSELKTR